MKKNLKDCQSAASSLGHNLTWKGIYGQPRKLVTDAVVLLSRTLETSLQEEGNQQEVTAQYLTSQKNRLQGIGSR